MFQMSCQRSEDNNLPPQLDKLQQELDEFYRKRVEGTLIPTRLKLGEKNNKYSLNIEKNKQYLR